MQHDEQAQVSTRRRTAYVLKVYPRFSETFIVTEILAREAAGEQLEIFALRPTTDTRFHPEIARVQAPVRFISKPYKLSSGWALHARAVASIPGFAQRYAAMLPELSEYEAPDVHQAIEVACEAVERGITHLHAHFASLAGRTAEVAAQLAGIEYSVTTHAKDIFHDSVVPERLGRTIARSHHTVTISQYNVDFLRSRYPEYAQKIQLVYNGLELARFPYRSPAPMTTDRPLRLAAVGRLVEKKGFFELVAAAHRLVSQGMNLDVRIAGDGELFQRLQAAIEIAGLQDVVTLLGARTQQEIRELLEWADVFAAPSVVGSDGNADGLPTVLLEAMASGVVCVASTVTGIPEAITDGKTGFLHEPGDEDGLVAALERAADPALDRAAMTIAARQHIAATFDSFTQARRLAALEDAPVPARSNQAASDATSDSASDLAVATNSGPGIEGKLIAREEKPPAPVMDLKGKRVAYVCVDPGIPIFGTKGASVHVQEVVREFIRRGASVTIFAVRVGDQVPDDLAHVEVVRYRIRTKETAAREAAQAAMGVEMAYRIVAEGFDLVYERYSLFSTVIAQVAQAGIPGILEVNAPLIEEQRDHRELVDESAARSALTEQVTAAAHTVTVSAAVADWVHANVRAGNVSVVPNGVNTDRITPGAPASEAERAQVLFVGTLKPWHGVDTLVAARELAREDWDVKIVGDGPMGEDLRNRVQQAGLTDRFTFTGAVAPHEIPQHLVGCAVATAPYPEVAAQDSYFSPLKVYEYLAAGLPVVASSIGQLPMILGESEAGILVPPSDPRALAQAIDQLVADHALRRHMAQQARALAISKHSWRSAVDQILRGAQNHHRPHIAQVNDSAELLAPMGVGENTEAQE